MTNTASALTDAAPDLLAALEAILCEVMGGTPYLSSDSYLPEHFIKMANVAIIKAKGK
jgi:hypothetical protein